MTETGTKRLISRYLFTWSQGFQRYGSCVQIISQPILSAHLGHAYMHLNCTGKTWCPFHEKCLPQSVKISRNASLFSRSRSVAVSPENPRSSGTVGKATFLAVKCMQDCAHTLNISIELRVFFTSMSNEIDRNWHQTTDLQILVRLESRVSEIWFLRPDN